MASSVGDGSGTLGESDAQHVSGGLGTRCGVRDGEGAGVFRPCSFSALGRLLTPASLCSQA